MLTWIVSGEDRYGITRQFTLRGPGSADEAMRFGQQIADVMRRNATEAGAADPRLRMTHAQAGQTDAREPLGQWKPTGARAIDLEMYVPLD